MKSLEIENLGAKQKKAAKICKLLIREHGDIIHERRLPPIDELILTILSQHTSDITADRAFSQLKESFPSWIEVMSTSETKIASAISSCGLYNLKAKRIKATLSEIHERVGALDLTLLEDMEIEEAKKWLTSLHGVGPKTAAIVLLFSFGRPVLPVDTHVWRVTKRLGLISEKTSRERAHILLMEIIPHSCVFSLNHNLVRHGRTVCRSQHPLCNECLLKDDCEYYLLISADDKNVSDG